MQQKKGIVRLWWTLRKFCVQDKLPLGGYIFLWQIFFPSNCGLCRFSLLNPLKLLKPLSGKEDLLPFVCSFNHI